MKNKNPPFAIAAALTILGALGGCGIQKAGDARQANLQVSPDTTPSGNATNGGTPTSGTQVASADALIGRIEVALQGNVNLGTGGKFAGCVNTYHDSLPNNSNPLTSSGVDQGYLLIYCACYDASATAVAANFGVTTTIGFADPTPASSPSPLPSGYAKNTTALIAAGIKMLDQNVAGLASTGPASAQVNAIFTTLLHKDAAIPGETTQLAFISVCMAAVGYGANSKGF